MTNTDTHPQVLVVADVWCVVDGLCDEVRHHAEGAESRVLVIAPALTGRVHAWTNDTDREAEVARSRLENILARLEQQGVSAEGRVADPDPALAVVDALAEFPATEVLLVAEEVTHANWLEHDLAGRIARPGLPVTRLTVPHELAL